MRIVVYGEPVAQGRPRFSTAGGYARAYDPAKSKDYKDYIRLAATQEMHGEKPLTGPIAFGLRVYRPIPKSMSKKRAALAEAGKIRPTTKPDLDNYLKGVLDALKSICWQDDSQIVDFIGPFGKYYSSTPRIEVEVESLEESEAQPCQPNA